MTTFNPHYNLTDPLKQTKQKFFRLKIVQKNKAFVVFACNRLCLQSSQRRESFLYKSDSEYDVASPRSMSRASSIASEFGCVIIISSSVADPDPSDPYVFGPPGSGSGSSSQRYGSGFGFGSGSFYHQATIVRKTLIPSVLWLLFDFLSMKNYVNDESSGIRIQIRIRIRNH
jgi:hypothetical protein